MTAFEVSHLRAMLLILTAVNQVFFGVQGYLNFQGQLGHFWKKKWYLFISAKQLSNLD